MKVVVVGAGIVGLACAYELVKDGNEVTVVDAGDVTSSTHGSAAKIALAESTPVPAPGMVLQGLRWMLKSDSPLYIRPSLAPSFLKFMFTMARHCTAGAFEKALRVHLQMAETCVDTLDEWVDEGLSYEMHRKGVLLVYEDQANFEERVKLNRVFGDFGMTPELLDADELHRREPSLSDACRHALFFPDDRQVEPDSLVAALTGKLRELGVGLQTQTRVTSFERSAGQVTGVVTDRGRVACDSVVLAAGVWTARLSSQLGAPLPIRGGRGYSVDYFPSPIGLQTPLTFEDAHMAVTPLEGRLRLAGTMEFSGQNEPVRPRRVEALKKAATQGFRDWDDEAAHLEPWAGLRPMTPDGLPIVGRLREGGNVVVASGHGMLGLTLAPSTATTVRDLVRPRPDGAVTRAVDAEFGPQRFLGGRKRRSA